ncbi:60S ribosomal protein L17B [Microbotryomycetes sp. JL201]|nr:60S ribosomal protein L17B [Microbotryomycetes sp. JL201]
MVSYRKSLRWPPDEAYEDTNTLVIQGKTGLYIDVMVDRKTLSHLSWGSAGIKSWLPESTPENPKARFDAIIDSQKSSGLDAVQLEEADDIGSFTTQPDASVLEKGVMRNVENGGQLQEYEEVWARAQIGDNPDILLLEAEDGKAFVGRGRYASSELIKDRKSVGISKGTYLRVHFKNTRETAAALQGLDLAKALTYLEDVQAHRQCIPYRRFNGAVGRTAQAKRHGVVQGRWPVKSAKFLAGLLKNAQANAEVNGLDINELQVRNIVVQQAPKTHRRTYRAHGRINPYKGHPCHIEIVLQPYAAEVPKADEPEAAAQIEA